MSASPARWPPSPARPCGRTPRASTCSTPIDEPDAVYARRLAFARDRTASRRSGRTPVASIAEELDGVEAVPRGDRELVDGVTVDTALGALEVIETPGHAPSHVVLYQRERRLLFSADIVSPVFTTYGDWGYSEDPIGEYRASLERVAELDVALALPGHGRPTEHLADLLDLYRTGFEQRLAAVTSARGNGAWAVSQEAFEPPGLPPVAVWNCYEAAGYLTHAAMMPDPLYLRGQSSLGLTNSRPKRSIAARSPRATGRSGGAGAARCSRRRCARSSRRRWRGPRPGSRRGSGPGPCGRA